MSHRRRLQTFVDETDKLRGDGFRKRVSWWFLKNLTIAAFILWLLSCSNGHPSVAVAWLCYSNVLRVLAAGAGGRCQLVPQATVSRWLSCESDHLSTTCNSCGLDIDGNTVPLARTKFQEPARVGLYMNLHSSKSGFADLFENTKENFYSKCISAFAFMIRTRL